MISRFFITRPIFACVISAFIVLAGLGGMRALPISAYPNIIPPMVTVTASYPGATAETIAETVAAPHRGADQRRREHAVHELGELRRRHADRST